ncbi:Mg/Co/Ni transporter MgtE / CBS domain [Vibrio astriarenae]|nr:Mg/Co/Ni transporter MgtE / CBS domain [Vibrio sp. C7]
MIRALATGELKKRQWVDVLWKESRVAICIAAVIALVIVGRILVFSDSSSTGGFDLNTIALAIAVALFIQVTISTILGGLLPILARAFKLDLRYWLAQYWHPSSIFQACGSTSRL